MPTAALGVRFSFGLIEKVVPAAVNKLASNRVCGWVGIAHNYVLNLLQ